MTDAKQRRDSVSVRAIARDAARDLWRVLPEVLWFQLLFAAAAFVALSPLVAWLFNRLAATSGNAAIGNLDIVWFLLTPTGGALGLAVLSVALALLFADVSGVLAILYAAARGRRITYFQALQFVGRSLVRLLLGSLAVLCLLILAMLPFVLTALWVAVSRLSEFDINYYLEVRPPEFLGALRWGVVLLALATLAAFVVAVPLVFVLPEVLFGNRGGWAAIRTSYHLASGARSKIAAMLVAWNLGWDLAALAINAAVYGVAIVAVAALGTNVTLQLAVLGGLAAVGLLASFALGLAAVAFGCGLLSRLYLAVTKAEANLPGMLSSAAPLDEQRRWTISRRAPLVVAIVLAVLAVVVVRQVLLSARFEDRVGIYAHRGSSIDAPENTLAAIDLAIAQGATGIEIDVQRTADGQIVAMHDVDLMRVAGSPLVVQDTNFDELRAVKVSGEVIPTLDEVLDHTARKVRLLVELKSLGGESDPLVRGVVEVIQRRQVVDQCAVMSFVYEEARAVKQLEPRLPVGFLVSARIGNLSRLEVDFLAVSRNQASDALVASAHARGRQVFVWTINDPRDMRTLINRGVDSLITKRPDLAVEILREREELDAGQRLLLRLKTLYLE